MKVPIIVTDRDGNVTAYDSVTAVERDIESVDVDAGEYRVFDSEGRLLAFEVEESTSAPSAPKRILGFGIVTPRPIHLSSLEDVPAHAAELRALLASAHETAVAAGDLSRAQQLGHLLESLSE